MPNDKAPYTFSFAAFLAGVRPKALRGWLDRNQVHFPSIEFWQKGGWRRFAIVDVLHLAIVASIIKYDFRIEFADRVAASITSGLTALPDSPANTESFSQLQNFETILSRNDEGTPRSILSSEAAELPDALIIRPFQIYGKILGRIRAADFDEVARSMRDDLEREADDIMRQQSPFLSDLTSVQSELAFAKLAKQRATMELLSPQELQKEINWVLGSPHRLKSDVDLDRVERLLLTIRKCREEGVSIADVPNEFPKKKKIAGKR